MDRYVLVVVGGSVCPCGGISLWWLVVAEVWLVPWGVGVVEVLDRSSGGVACRQQVFANHAACRCLAR